MTQIQIESPDEVMRLVNKGIDERESLLREAAMMGCAGNMPLAEAFRGMRAEAAGLRARTEALEQEVAALMRRLVKHEDDVDDRVTTLEESLYRHQGA